MAARRRAPRGSGLPPLRALPPAPTTDPAAQPAPKEATDFERWRDGLTPAERTVAEVEDMMLQGRWVPGRSDKILAQMRGCSPSYIRSLAAEASRNLRKLVREDEGFRQEQRDRFVMIATAIEQRALTIGSPNALRVALEAGEMRLRYMGIEPPRLPPARSRGEFEGLSDAEVAAIATGEDEDNGRTDGGAPVH